MSPTRAIGMGYGKKSTCVKSLTLELRSMCQSNRQPTTLKRVTRHAQDDHFWGHSAHRCDGRRLVDCHVRQVESCGPRRGHRDVGAGLAARDHGQAGPKPPGRILGCILKSKRRDRPARRSCAAQDLTLEPPHRLEAALVYAMIPMSARIRARMGSW